MKFKKIITIVCVCLVSITLLSFLALAFSGNNGGGGSKHNNTSDSVVDSPNAPVLVDKTITENGVYNPVDDGADGYSSITVAVPSTSDGSVMSLGFAGHITIADMAINLAWENGTRYTSFNVFENPLIVCTASNNSGANSGKYYTTGNSWRLYASEGGNMTLSTVAENFVIVAVCVDFSQGVLVNNSSEQIVSGQYFTVNDNSITITCLEGTAYIVGIGVVGFYK